MFARINKQKSRDPTMACILSIATCRNYGFMQIREIIHLMSLKTI